MTEEHPVETHESPPHPWLHIAVGMGVLTLCGVAAAYLIADFVLSRPLDLLEPTRKAAANVEAVLQANRVPAAAIERTGPKRREHETAHWNYYEYDVRVPSSLSLSGLEKVIEKRMRAQSLNIGVTDYVVDGRKEGLRLSYGDITFALVRMRASSAASTVAYDEPQEALMEADEAAAEPKAETAGTQPDSDESKATADATATAVAVDPGADLEPLSDARTNTAEGVRKRDEEEPVEADEPKGKLAIVLDDGGYGGDVTDAVLQLPNRLTLAILPFAPASRKTAQRAHEAGFEVMLHLPMENGNPDTRSHEGELTVDMSESEIAALTEKALEEVPHAVGINNHMGSTFTSDPVAMARFLTALKSKDMFFLDSRTTAETKAYELAQTFGFRAARRDLFLDHTNAPEAIRRHVRQAVELAKAEGAAIAIGHFRPATVEILAELLPTLSRDDVELVPLSELVE